MARLGPTHGVLAAHPWRRAMPQCARALWRRPPPEVYGDGGAKTGGEQSEGAASPAPTAHCAGVDVWLAVPEAPLSTQPVRRGTAASVQPRQRSPRRASHGLRRPSGRRKVCVMMHSCREVGILHPRAGCSACLDAPAPHPSEIITYPCLSSSHTLTSALCPPREVSWYGY